MACYAGQTGLEVCSGLTTDRKKAQDAEWVSFDPVPGAITINIGDSLQYWSDGALKSTYHRVRCPAAGEYAVSLPPCWFPFPVCFVLSVALLVSLCGFEQRLSRD